MSLQSLLGASSEPLEASVSPTTVYGSRHGAGTCTSTLTTATIIGGVAPYTHSWTRVSGDATTSATNASGNPTAFSTTFSTLDDEKDSTWQYIATDAMGATSAPVQVSVTLFEVSFS